MYWGDYQGTHYLAAEADRHRPTWRRLRAAWSTPVPGDNVSESTPLVVDGVMYGTSGGNPRTVTAMDARTGTSDLAVHAPAESPQSGRDRRRQPRRRDPRPPAVRRHERRGARLPRRADGAAPLGSPGRRHDGGLQHHQPAAHREGQDHRRARRRRIRAPRLPRRLRRDRQAAVAVLHDSGAGRVRQRHVEGRQLEDRRRRHVADRHLRSGARHRLLADRQSGAR